MAWSDFSFTANNLKQWAADVLHKFSPKNVDRAITNAQSIIEEKLKGLIYTKFQQAGYTIPDDLPDTHLDAIQSDAYDQIKRLVAYKTMYLLYIEADNTDLADYWNHLYSESDMNLIVIYIDLNEDDEITSGEFTDYQSMLDDRIR